MRRDFFRQYLLGMISGIIALNITRYFIPDDRVSWPEFGVFSIACFSVWGLLDFITKPKSKKLVSPEKNRPVDDSQDG
jgi:hypothetical protein